MAQGKVGSRQILDATLLSTSAIGSPAAFSTAIKPPGNFSANPNSADSSLLAHHPHDLIDNVAGQLSLSLASEPLYTEGLVTDDTSLGILDLDNIQESSMSVFLTSPRSNQDVHASKPSTTTTHHSSSSSATTVPPLSSPSPPPSMGPLKISAATASRLAPETVVMMGEGGEEEEEEGWRGEVSLPEELLEASGSVGYSSSDGEGEQEMATAGVGGGMEQQTEKTLPVDHGVVSIPDHMRQSGDGHETEVITSLMSQGHPQLSNLLPPRERSGDGGGFSVAEILLGAQREGEGVTNDHLFASQASHSLITEQEEPSLVREITTEFSRLDPNHLTSVINRESLLYTSSSPSATDKLGLNARPLVTSLSTRRMTESHQQTAKKSISNQPPSVSSSSISGSEHIPSPLSSRAVVEGSASPTGPVATGSSRGREITGQFEGGGESELQTSALSTDAISPEGLPSAYLCQSSLYSSVSQTPSPSGTPDSPSSPSSSPLPPTNSQSSLASSLTRLAGDLGLDERPGENGGERAHQSPSFNPFDSEDMAVAAVGVREEEFGERLDSDSFMACLEADEVAVQEANKMMLPSNFSASTPHTPSFTSLSSSSSSAVPPPLTQSGERELSIGAYFGQRSYKLGVLQASDLVASNERPQFSGLSSDLVKTPPTPDATTLSAALPPKTSPTSQTSPSSPDHAADTTLVAPTGDSEEASPDRHTHTTPQVYQPPPPPRSELAQQLVFSTHVSCLESQVAPTLATGLAQTHIPAATVSSGFSTRGKFAAGTQGKTSPPSVLGSKALEQVASGASLPRTTSQVARVSVESLTPVVTVHTPFPTQFDIPKLDLSSKTVDLTPTTTARTSTGLKQSPPGLSAEFKHFSLPQSLSHPLLTNTPGIRSSSLSLPLSTTTMSGSLTSTSESGSNPPLLSPADMESGLEGSGMDSGMSSGMDQRLASQYWKPGSASSTLMFPELSATSLSPPPPEMGGLSCMPTPSIMTHLSGGFNATTNSRDGSFLESLLGALPTFTGQLSSIEHSSMTAETTRQAASTTVLAAQVQGQHTSTSTISTASPSKSVQSSPSTAGINKARNTHSPPTVKSTGSTPKKTRSPAASLSPSSPTIAAAGSASSHTTEGSPGKEASQRKQQPLSPKTNAAKKKLAELKATLDATRFDAEAYLSRLKEEKQESVPRKQSSSSTTETAKALSFSFPPSPDSLLHSYTANETTTVSESASLSTVASQSPLATPKLTSQSPAAVTNTTVAAKTTTAVSESTTAVSQGTTTTIASASFIAAVSSGLALSPQKSTSLPSTVSPAPSVSQASTVGSSGKQSPHGGTTLQKQGQGRARQQKETERSVRKSPKGEPSSVEEVRDQESRSHKQFVAVRDVGVGTTPGLQRAQPRSSPHTDSEGSTKQPPLPPPPPVTESPTTSPQRQRQQPPPQFPLLSPPLASLTTTPSSRKDLSSSSQPIYTSPRLLPHTSTLSPPHQLHSQPLHHRERRNTPQPNTLRVPESLCFKSPCCVGVTLPDQLEITNIGDRWLQLSFKLGQLYCSGTLCQTAELQQTFSFPHRCFVSPRKTESIKVTFSPREVGSYEAVLTCKAKLVVSSERDDSNFISESIVVKALAVPPLLEVTTSSAAPGEACLDYGVLVAGSSLSLPLHLANHGTSELPLRLSIAAPTLAQLHLSFDELPPSLKPPPSSPSSYLHHVRPFSTALVLPPKPQKSQVYSVNVNFKSPKNFTDDSSPLGPPEEIKAQVNVSVEGPNSTGVLCSVPVRATVGVARLHVPRSLQALSISCTEGQRATRDVPFRNAGNIPLRIALKFSSTCDHFSVSPGTLDLAPNQEAQVKVNFSPPASPLVVPGCLMIHVQPDGPSYELKVQGTAVKTEEVEENLLLCNKRSLYWGGGVNLGDTAEQKLLLQNGFSSPVPLQFSIRHQNQAFHLQTDEASVCWTHETELLPHGQFQMNVLFTPPSTAVFRNALDIFDAARSKKFRIPLCGYGGRSVVEVMNARRSPVVGLWLDLGAVSTDKQSRAKLALYNSGERAAFVKAVCLPLGSGSEGEDLSPLSPDRASVTPSQCVLQPQQMQELSVAYRPASSGEVATCSGSVSPLAQLAVMHGDEIVRQRFQRVLAASGEGEREEGEEGAQRYQQLSNKFNEEFLQRFPGQESVSSELDFGLFEVESEEAFFEQHVHQTSITLSGSPSSESPPLLLKQTQQPLSTSPPEKTLHKLSPSHSILQATPPSHAHHQMATPSSRIVSSHTLILPDSVVDQHTDKMLDVHNPYTQPLHWQLASVASPFVRDAVGTNSDICKANYSAFWVRERRGTVPPHSTAQVQVAFQPHDVGSFSQMWDLQVSCKDIDSGSKKIRLSFGGKAVPTREIKTKRDATSGPAVPRVRFVNPPPPAHPPSNPPTQPPNTTVATSHPPPSSLTKRAVYIKEDSVEFPQTRVGDQSILKLKVCNRDKCNHQFQVVSLMPPFSVQHHNFELGSRQCARLPVIFSPTQAGVFQAVMAVKTAAGHQAFSQLTGLATSHPSM